MDTQAVRIRNFSIIRLIEDVAEESLRSRHTRKNIMPARDAEEVGD